MLVRRTATGHRSFEKKLTQRSGSSRK
uniref:Uncharacterized protein n=1 Tax=Anguilla anguilla TaxID=7936 RepID=A0A0E9W8I5_ANGAN